MQEQHGRDRADLTLVIPTYNERGSLGGLLERVFAACESQAFRSG
jgi:hypothetical protein